MDEIGKESNALTDNNRKLQTELENLMQVRHQCACTACDNYYLSHSQPPNTTDLLQYRIETLDCTSFFDLRGDVNLALYFD